ncbi:bifunctional glutamate N-acetyltransferase/amino-acid acetyltransferase ArgJ [Candidatus Poribacteria bacterium]|nr:bifunctional glutamate N-acetyltransferase/amino-acid acetyltransferase ArgJ [Candidatus Poribacteria bacterium]
MIKDNIVKGFVFSGINCSIKKTLDNDLGIIFSEVPGIAAGVFTKNKVKAAPVKIDIEHIKNPCCRAIVVNSGNANACTGTQGEKDAKEMVELTAKNLGISSKEVLVSSTGVIGNSLPMDKVRSGIEKACKNFSSQGIENFAKAIMTTDVFLKKVYEKITLGDKEISILGVAKGAGMICPNMATLLCFITTDLNIEKEYLQKSLTEAADASFNLITVDTDTSTNDSVIIMANGLSGNKKISSKNEDYEKFALALTQVLKKLAHMIVEDGEGATKFIIIKVKNAKTREDAKTVAMSVAKSSLVKTAFFGEDANWGRIICAVGYAGVDIDPDMVDIFLEKAQVVSKGQKAENIREPELKEILKNKEITVNIDLNQGNCSQEVYTCDLTYNYVKINASYRS